MKRCKINIIYAKSPEIYFLNIGMRDMNIHYKLNIFIIIYKAQKKTSWQRGTDVIINPTNQGHLVGAMFVVGGEAIIKNLNGTN